MRYAPVASTGNQVQRFRAFTVRYNLPVVTLDINGERMEFNSNPRVADLVAKLALEGKKIAVERNGEIVPRSRFPDTWLADGDRLEIVVAVGGG
jgi:sulfur carrier protein